MSLPDSELTRQFYEWEHRGRGWQVFPAPVSPEPPFIPFEGHALPFSEIIDDGRKHTILSSLIEKARKHFSQQSVEDVSEPEGEPEPEWIQREALVEIQVRLPSDTKVSAEIFDRFLSNISKLQEPVSFEIFGTSENVIVQFAVSQMDAGHMRRQLQAYFPEATVLVWAEHLETLWQSFGSSETAIVEFGLAQEFMLSLALDSGDLLVGIVAALAELQEREFGLLQVIFQPVQSPWGDSILRSTCDDAGKPFFINRPELVAASNRKISRPLYGVVIRVAAKSDEFDRTWDIVRELAASLGGLAQVDGNELIPLRNDEYPTIDHDADVIKRQSRRCGMILNRDELLALVHLPTAAIRTKKLVRETGYSKAAPANVRNESGLFLGHNIHAGEIVDVRLSPEHRVRHTHIIGASGTGKSTFLFNLIHQDVKNGEGLAVLDPHGDLIDQILESLPENRINDVVLLDPSDPDYSIGFNVLSAHSDLEKTLLASDLSSVFQRLSTSWGDQMHSVLNNAILAFLESTQGGTLADMRRFLLELSYREQFLKTVTDSEVIYYWRKGFPQLGGNKSIGPLITRLGTFLTQKPIRYMVSQQNNRLDFADIMNTGKIFLAKLSQGQIGKENTYLLGSLLMSKFQQQAMSRQSMEHSARKSFWLYVDEFHNFITPSIAEILTDVRKYRMGMILAHQELRQLQRDSEVAAAVLSNTATRIVFRVGDADAKVLGEGFSNFKSESLRNLSTGEAICRVERSDFDFNLSTPLPDVTTSASIKERVISASRSRYATPRLEVEAMLQTSSTVTAPAIEEIETPEEKLSPQPVATEVPKTPEEIIASIPKRESPKPKSEPKEVVPPPDMGRGGAQHQAIQQRIKADAEKLGFRVILEKQVLDGHGSIDMVLEKMGFVLACEINVTSSIDYEVGNARKCLKAGFQHVASICPKPGQLQKLANAIRGCLSAEDAKKVEFFSPDEFVAYLQKLDLGEVSSVPAPTEETNRGYKIKRTYVQLTPEESKAREDEAIKLVAEKMRRKRKG